MSAARAPQPRAAAVSAREARELDDKVRPRSMASHISNVRTVTFVRTGMAVIAGCAAGILGLTGGRGGAGAAARRAAGVRGRDPRYVLCGRRRGAGLSGFAMCVVLHVVASAALLGWMRMDAPNCVGAGALEFVADGILGQMLTYILCWTFAFAMVHVY